MLESVDTQLLVPLLAWNFRSRCLWKDETGHEYGKEVKELTLALMGKRVCVQALSYVNIY